VTKYEPGAEVDSSDTEAKRFLSTIGQSKSDTQNALIILKPGSDGKASCVVVIPEGVPRGTAQILAVVLTGKNSSASRQFLIYVRDSPLTATATVILIVVLAALVLMLVVWDHRRRVSERWRQEELERTTAAIQASEYHTSVNR
jgi:hypothetical protein